VTTGPEKFQNYRKKKNNYLANDLPGAKFNSDMKLGDGSLTIGLTDANCR